MDIGSARYAELVIIEDKYNRLCEVLKNRTWRGLASEEIRFLQAMLGIKKEVENDEGP